MSPTSSVEDTFSAEQSLATTAMLLLQRGHVSAAELLTSIKHQFWEPAVDAYNSWRGSYYDVVFEVPLDLLDAFDNQTLKLVRDTMNAVTEGYDKEVYTLRVRPSPTGGDWRSTVAAARQRPVSNHGVLTPLPASHPSLDRLKFRDMAELTVYKELKREQETRAEHETLTIIPNCAVRVLHHTWEVDFVVVYKQRAGIIEVDGSSHNVKRESDKSRDRLLENAGFAYVDRFDARECENTESVQRLVTRFLGKLRDRV